MCLDTLTDDVEIRTDSGIGWKVFNLREDKLYPEYFAVEEPYEINSWYEAYDFTKSDYQQNIEGLRYCRGFHLFTTEKGAYSWKRSLHGKVIRKVKWRHRLALGKQGGYYTIVAKEILILR